MCDLDGFSTSLLAWYDINARVMPWRVGPADRAIGVRPDPYHVWLSEVMLQQTTVAVAAKYFERFVSRWPRVEDLASAENEDVMEAWAGLGYYARARNLVKTAKVVAFERGGSFPEDEAGLRTLPGVGPYTAAAIAAIAFDKPAAVVDGNVKRVLSRLGGMLEIPPNPSDIWKKAKAMTPQVRSGDYAQAVMDLGATVCRPRAPRCDVCPWMNECIAYASGQPERHGSRRRARRGPERNGVAFVAVREDGAVLLERRPSSGLLGGTLGWPGSSWVDAGVTRAPSVPPCSARWQAIEGAVHHSFTHFDLRVQVLKANVPMGCNPERGFFVESDEFSAAKLPTVMRKIWELAGRSDGLREPERSSEAGERDDFVSATADDQKECATS